MSLALTPPWTTEDFLAWAGTQEGRYEFDGFQPVAITGGTARHNRIMLNIHAALRARLRGTPCSSFGPDLGIGTSGGAIRYPDALVTCTRFQETEKLAPDPVAAFEVLSPDSGRRDRIEKVREYGTIPSLRHYVIVESTSPALFVLHRAAGDHPWTALTLTQDDTLTLPFADIAIPISEFYEDVDFTADSLRSVASYPTEA